MSTRRSRARTRSIQDAALAIAIAVSLLAALPTHASAANVTVSVIAPAGGEVWTGGTVHDIRWTMDSDSGNPSLLVDIDYLVGGTPTPITAGLVYPVGTESAYAWSVPQLDVANVTIRVCATDIAGGSACNISATFDLDATPPVVVSRSPTGSNVALADPIVIEFSDDMNETSVRAALSISPDAGPLDVEAFKNLVFANHTVFNPGQNYTVTIGCSATDRSDPGNAVLGCPIAWTFRTATPPSATVLAPAGGERWTGGTSHDVRWAVQDAEDSPDTLSATLEWSPDGLAWLPLAGPFSGSGTFSWSVPAVDADSARVRATVLDTRSLSSTALSNAFAIDSTPPGVAVLNPSDGAAGVGWRGPVVVIFTEAVVGPVDPGTLGIRDPSGGWVRGTVSRDSPSQIRFTPSADYRSSETYTAVLNATLRDASAPGNFLPAPIEWRFTTRANSGPSIALLEAPSGTLSGNSTWTVSWIAGDPEDAPADLRVFLEFSDGGAFAVVAGPLPASGAYAWTAPSQDAATAALLVRVLDTKGGQATAARTFAIDATAPNLVEARPPPGADDVSPLAPIHIAFSEPMDPASIDAVSVGDEATGTWVPLQRSWEDPTTLRLVPLQPLRELGTYVVVVNGTATDRSLPGNPVVPRTWSFVVAASPPSVAILDPQPGIRWTGGRAQTILVDAEDALDPGVTLTAELASDGVAFAPVLPPTPSPNGQRSLIVTPPEVDAPDAVLKVCASDATGATSCATLAVEIDATPPSLLTASPAPGERPARPDSPLVLTFSESVEPASVEAAFGLGPSTPTSFRWAHSRMENDTVFVDHPPLLESRTYTATLACTVRDVSVPGLTMRDACPLAWAFTTATTPDIRLLSPRGGERFTAGMPHEVVWVSADDDRILRTTIAVSLDGSAFESARGPEMFATGEVRAAIPLPPFDGARAVVRVTVEDGLGLTSSAQSPPFILDATPPTLVATVPGAGAVDVFPLEDVVLVFDEPVDPASVLDAVHVVPSLRDPIVTWSGTRVPFDTVRISHAAIRLGTAVTVVLDGVRDTSSPGNLLTTSFAFTVAPDRERPHARLAVASEVYEGDVVVFDASASTDNDAIVEYSWTVRDREGASLGRLFGPRVEYRATRAGTLDVALRVTDPSGNVADASAPLRVRALTGALDTGGGFALPPSLSVLGWLALAGAGVTAYGLTERGRSWLSRILLIPLYTKLRPEAILDQETRGMIRGYLRVHPGDSYSDLKRNLGLANGVLAYHLSVLEREGIIRSVAKGARRLYYPADMPIPEDGGGLHEVQRRLLRNVGEVPGMSIRDLAGAIGVSSQLVLYHVRKLREEGLVRVERRGVKLRVFPMTAEERRVLLGHDET